MRIWNLVTYFISRGVGWGLTLGTGLSFLYTVLLFVLFFREAFLFVLFYSVVLGMLSGVVLGGVNGLSLSIVAILFACAGQPIRYLAMSLLCSLLVTGISAFMLFNSIFPDSFVLTLPATFLAMIAAGYASQVVSRDFLQHCQSDDEQGVQS